MIGVFKFVIVSYFLDLYGIGKSSVFDTYIICKKNFKHNLFMKLYQCFQVSLLVEARRYTTTLVIFSIQKMTSCVKINVANPDSTVC